MTTPTHIRELALELDKSLPTWHVARRQGLTIFGPYVVLREENLRVHHSARIDSFVKLECGEGLYIGELVHVASFCHLGIGGGVTIVEDGTAFSSGAKLISGSNLPGRGHGCSAVDPRSVIERSFVHVKRNAILFSGATVLPGCTVGENSVVAAGAVVTRDVPAFEIWGGVPARKIRDVK